MQDRNINLLFSHEDDECVDEFGQGSSSFNIKEFIMSIAGAQAQFAMTVAPERPITTGKEQPSPRNTIDRLLDTVQRTQAGGLDAPASTLALLDELKKSSDPALSAIGKKIDLLDKRLGGTYDSKVPELLKNMATMLSIEGGVADRNLDKSADNSETSNSINF